MQDHQTMRSSVQRTGKNQSNLSVDVGQSIVGRFGEDGFNSRCADHDSLRPGSWRSLNGDPGATLTRASDDKAGSLSRVVARMKSFISWSDSDTFKTPAPRRPINAAVPASPLSAAHPVSQDVYSNQMSS